MLPSIATCGAKQAVVFGDPRIYSSGYSDISRRGAVCLEESGSWDGVDVTVETKMGLKSSSLCLEPTVWPSWASFEFG